MKDTELFNIVSATLTGSGFTRHGRTWYKSGDRLVVVLNLQKSQWGDGLVFVNMAFWLRDLGEPAEIPPKESQCHVRIRADAAFFEIASEIMAAFNLGSDMPDEVRKARVASYLRDRFIPFLDRCSSLRGLAAAVRSEQFSQGAILLSARPVLDPNTP